MACENFNRGKETEKVGLVGIVGNLFLFLIKIFIAILCKSQSLLADSVNSATDILSSIMTYVGGKISQNESDENHNYGYGKAEYVFSLLISIVMAYLAITVAINGAKTLILKEKFVFSYILILSFAIFLSFCF